MTWICLIYVLVSFLLACGLGTENYWPQRLGIPRPGMQNPTGYGQPYGDPRPVDNYPAVHEDGVSDYTDDERNNMQRADDQTGWVSPPAPPPAGSPTSFQSPYSAVPEWPTSNKKLGQVSAVCFDLEGNVIIFHRGDHVWGGQSFLANNVYNQKELGPIEDNTIVTFDATTGNILHEWGASLFYMPHGLSVDPTSNVWVTDVALHQVFKFAPKGGVDKKPLLVLGTRFEPGNDDKHFCKPSAVAVTTSGDIFVADGYCNHRIIKFNSEGKKILVWGRSMLQYGMAAKTPPPNAFAIPHALALAEDKGIVCVADRENGRILCFSFNGTFITQIKLPEFGSKLFSVAYSPVQGGLLFAVNGEDLSPFKSSDPLSVHGFVIGLTSQQLVAEFAPSLDGFKTPHDIAVSTDGKQIYVAQLDPHKVWKFVESPESINLQQFSTSRLKIVQSTMSSSSSQPTPSTTTAVALNLLAKDALQSPSHTLLPSIEPTPHLLTLSLQIFIVAAAVMALTLVTVLFVCLKRGPWCNYWICYKRWQFRREPSDGFKLGSLLDPHSGFEQVCTEMSDEEEIDSAGAAVSGGINIRNTAEPLIPRA